MATQRKKKSAKDLLARIHERYKVMTEADQDNRRLAMEDLKFANEPGAQWDANMKKERGDRPCYEFNKLRINGKRVINEIRANRPQGKVRAVEGGDKQTAGYLEGLCRNIANISDIETITDNAAEYQVDGGMACWRVVTEYSGEDVFDQDILVKGIKNPFCLWADPACKDPLKRDAEDWILEDRLTQSAFEAKYPKAARVNWEPNEFDDQDEWEDDDSVRVVEYWYKEPYDKELWQVKTPAGTLVVDSTTDEAPAVQESIKSGEYQLLKTRMARCYKVMMCVASGDAILEGPMEQVGTQFPFVMVHGEFKIVDGKIKWWGLHRFAKDAQRSYNISRTAIDETIALAPQAKWWASQEQAKGLTNQWSEAHLKNFPFLLYNPDPLANGPPQRMGGADVPLALIQQSAISSQDIRDVTGLHETSFGEESSEKSGIALARKQNQAQIVTYNFPDNMAKGIKRTWEIMLDYIPHVYDAERELRILGNDGAEDYVKVNQVKFDPATGKSVRVNDITTGKYDVTITVGPSFSTLRQEAATIYGEIAAKNPALQQVAGDLLFKAMDLPYSDEIAERFQAILPPAIQQMLSKGKEIPPEAQAVMAQANQAMQMVQQQTLLVQQAAQEVEQSKAASEQAKANVEKAISQLKVERAQFDADITKKLSELAIKEAGLQQREIALQGQQQQTDAGATDLSEAKQAVQQIDQMAAKFMEAASEIMAQIDAQKGVVIAMPKRSKLKGMKATRVNGELIAVPEYDGESDEPRIAKVRMMRGADGSMMGVPEYEDSMPKGMMQ